MEFDIGAAEAADARPAAGQPDPGEQLGTADAAQDGTRTEDEASAASGSREREEFSQLIGATGQPSVDAALSGLRQLADLPVAEHAAVFERTHQRLHEVLGELDADLPTGAHDPAGAQDPANAQGRPGAAEHDGS